MKSVKKNRPVFVGIFIILGIIILIVAVFALGGQKKTFVKGFKVSTVFDDVNGLVSGDNVWLSGVKIGTVKKLTFLPNTQVLVTMVLQKSLEPNIRENSLTKISSDGLIGNKIVVIFGGTTTSPQITDGSTLVAQKALSTEDMLVTLQANNKNLLAITGSFKNISNKIDSGNGVLGSLLNNQSVAKKINTSVDELQSVMSNFQAASIKSKAVLGNLEEFTNRLNTQGSSINKLATDTTMFTSLKGTISQLNNIALTAGEVTDNLKTMSNNLTQKNNVAGVLLNDPEAAADLKQTIKNLNSSSEKLNEDLEAAQHNFLLRGFFKKKNKQQSSQVNKTDSL